jgi:hypothetical protein
MYPSIFNRFLVTSLCLLTPFLMWSQQANVNLDWNPQKNTENLTPFSAPLNSPEVQDDGRVNFIMDNLSSNFSKFSNFIELQILFLKKPISKNFRITKVTGCELSQTDIF